MTGGAVGGVGDTGPVDRETNQAMTDDVPATVDALLDVRLAWLDYERVNRRCAEAYEQDRALMDSPDLCRVCLQPIPFAGRTQCAGDCRDQSNDWKRWLAGTGPVVQ